MTPRNASARSGVAGEGGRTRRCPRPAAALHWSAWRMVASAAGRVTCAFGGFLESTLMWKAGIIAVVGLAAWRAAEFPQPEARANEKASENSATLLPPSFAKGKLEQFRAQLAAKPDYVHTLTRIEYAGNVYWVVDMHLGDGVSYKHVALYAPEKDGSHRQCLFAESWAAGWLRVQLDDKTGVLELREAANSPLKGQ